MRRFGFLLGVVLVFAIPATALAIGLEVAVGVWNQTPSGDLSYKLVNSTDSLDLDNELGYDSETRFIGRIKIDMPLLIPNVYIMATPMSFSGTGQKNVNFTFGDQAFQGSTDFDSDVNLTHYDLALYYGLPFVKLATADMLNVDVGLNLRLMDLSAEVNQSATGLSEKESVKLPVPMVFLAAQIQPLDRFGIEGELRGVAFSGNSYLSMIGRLKVKVFGPLFATAGYRYDTIDVDEDDFKLDADFGGLFFEVGASF